MKNLKKSISPPSLVALLAGAAMLGLVSQSALALTTSGFTISNSATLGYTVGGVAQTAITSAAATFTVDNKINMTVSGGAITSVSPGQANATTTFTVSNLGNAVQGYALTVGDTAGAVFGAATDNFNAGAYTIYQDATNNTAAGGACTTISAVVITKIADLNAGASACVWVKAALVPATQVNGDAAVITLNAVTTWPNTLVAVEAPVGAVANAVVTATAGANTAGVDVVLADAATVLPLDAAYNGAYTAYGAYKVSSAILSVSKVTTVLCDPFNGGVITAGVATGNQKNIPGAVVQYAITISNAATATAAATLSQVTDTLVASLAFEPKLISGVSTPANAATNCVSGFAGTSLSASGFGVFAATGTTASGYVAPGLAANATTAGATVVGSGVTIDFPTLTAGAGIIPAALAAGALPVNSAITVYFNAVVQ